MNKSGGIKVPKFIGRLKELRYLNLSVASFTSSVSSFLGNLSNLQVLDLGGTEFPHWLKDQNELNNIIFNTTGISNVVADWFVELDLKLDNLDMAYNNLTGKVPKA
ncbi:hypothetical protein MTR67_026787 [Solanum verrucosum]|uniref:Uncharacterized protein n=1 Tax=Solanum verrucosum TaxID=315347 RepID=A0AAF0QZM9_SOLVR|nr:hypothetical protein MTR67_026787 [Solanum verrucosum]